jgi:hypothetical protein
MLEVSSFFGHRMAKKLVIIYLTDFGKRKVRGKHTRFRYTQPPRENTKNEVAE